MKKQIIKFIILCASSSLLSFVALSFQQLVGFQDMRLTWVSLLLIFLGSIFITYSKWSDTHIWNKIIFKSIIKSNKKPKEEKINSKVDELKGESVVRGFANIILIILALMLLVNILSY